MLRQLTLTLPPPAETVCLNKLPHSFSEDSHFLPLPPSLLVHTHSAPSQCPSGFVFDSESSRLLQCGSSAANALCQNRNSAGFDTLAACVQTLWHINEQCSPRKHDRATGFLSIDCNDFAWPLSVLCLHMNQPSESRLNKKTEMLDVKLLFFPWIRPLCSPTGLFVLKWFDCFCAAICLSIPTSPRSVSVYLTAMHLFGLNWQLQELDNQPAFENGGVGKTGPTQSSVVTALAADGEELKTLTSE